MRLEQLATSLESQRLVLRCFEQRDVGELFEAISRSREHLERWLEWPATMTSMEELAEWVCGVEPGRYDATQPFGMGLFAKSDGRLVGAAGLKVRSFSLRAGVYQWLDVSYWIDVRALGNGYAREAVRRLARHAIDDLGVQRVELRIETGNAQSIVVAERAGFRFEGVLRATMLRHGALRDVAVFSLLPAELA
jgi:RimJ/RimL family protein N-acetyltransferase